MEYAVASADAPPEPLFKALADRDREKELTRLTREVAEAQHAHGLANR